MPRMDTPRLRPALDQVPAYVAGKPPVPREGLTVYKVSSNENPNPPLPSVVKVIEEAATQVNRYPDMGVTALTDALAAHLAVPREQIATGTGSVGVLARSSSRRATRVTRSCTRGAPSRRTRSSSRSPVRRPSRSR